MSKNWPKSAKIGINRQKSTKLNQKQQEKKSPMKFDRKSAKTIENEPDQQENKGHLIEISSKMNKNGSKSNRPKRKWT